MTDDDVAATLERLPALVNDNGPLVRRGRFLSTVFRVGAGDLPVHITVRDGRIEEVAPGPSLMRSWRFAIHADADSWGRFWEPVPPPGYHDLLAMTRFGTARLDGDLQPLMANLRYIKEVLEAPRHAVEGLRHGG